MIRTYYAKEATKLTLVVWIQALEVRNRSNGKQERKRSIGNRHCGPGIAMVLFLASARRLEPLRAKL
jgi:hypothetical protein